MSKRTKKQAKIQSIIDPVGALINDEIMDPMLFPEKPPEPAPLSTMPTIDDAQVKLAKRRTIAETLARRGRASTILSDSATDTLGT